MRIKHILAVLVLLICFHQILGLTCQYHIRALGMNVATLEITRNPSPTSVTVKSKSLISNALFPAIDNSYHISFDGSYKPLIYKRVINQEKIKDTVTIQYDHKSKQAKMHRVSTAGETSYGISENSRDFFSFMTMVGDKQPGSGTYVLDGNGVPWTAQLTYLEDENISTPLGKFDCRVYSIKMSPQTKQKTPYVDMVTNNLFNKDSKIKLWISRDGIAVKAAVKKGMLATNWELLKIIK